MPLSSKRSIPFILLGVILLLAIGITLRTALQPKPSPTLVQPLAEMLPKEIDGWTMQDKPIAETEEMKKAVGEMLNYDDAIFRHYSKNGITISVYAAYWQGGKMSSRLIGAHTPDNCWVNAGWACTARNFALPLTLDNKPLRDSQWGVYTIQNVVQHVLFWHVSNGRLIAYNTGRLPPWWAPLTDMWRHGLDQRGEQFFIRISSNVPVEKFWNTEIMHKVIEALGPLVLYPQPTV